MRVLYCPVCGMPVHMAAWIPLTAKCIEDVWDIWFCDSCKWCSDWSGDAGLSEETGMEQTDHGPVESDRRSIWMSTFRSA